MNFSEAKFYDNYQLISDFHTNIIIWRRVCLPVKMASKIVIMSIAMEILPGLGDDRLRFWRRGGRYSRIIWSKTTIHLPVRSMPWGTLLFSSTDKQQSHHSESRAQVTATCSKSSPVPPTPRIRCRSSPLQIRGEPQVVSRFAHAFHMS